MNRSVWRKALFTGVVMSFGICFGVIVPVLVVIGIDTLAELVVPAMIIASLLFVFELPLYLYTFSEKRRRKERE